MARERVVGTCCVHPPILTAPQQGRSHRTLVLLGPTSACAVESRVWWLWGLGTGHMTPGAGGPWNLQEGLGC